MLLKYKHKLFCGGGYFFVSSCSTVAVLSTAVNQWHHVECILSLNDSPMWRCCRWWWWRLWCDDGDDAWWRL